MFDVEEDGTVKVLFTDITSTDVSKVAVSVNDPENDEPLDQDVPVVQFTTVACNKPGTFCICFSSFIKVKNKCNE